MTWTSLTTPPPPRTPTPKHPLFTKNVFSTKSFGPGHLVGAGILVLGGIGLMKFIKRGRAQAEQSRQFLTRPARPAGAPPDEAQLAKVENVRGQYGTP